MKHIFNLTNWFFLTCFFFCACDNSCYDVEKDTLFSSIEANVRTALGHSDENIAFVFFSDPHLLGLDYTLSSSLKSNLVASFNEMKQLYDNLPLAFCLNGGDWLNNKDTQATAKEKLLFADSEMKRLFPQYHKMMGNHDTNYQGVVSTDDSSRGDLSREWVDAVYFCETGSAFYSFAINNTSFFILDSGLDWDVSMNDYRWEQIMWLAGKLQDLDLDHIVLGIHMFYRAGKMIPMSEELVRLCDSYNNKISYTAKGVEFDFSKSTGTINSIFSGHMHKDSLSFVGVNKDIPSIQTCNFMQNGSKSFDVCVIDYSSGYIEMFRIGDGDNRRVLMAR